MAGAVGLLFGHKTISIQMLLSNAADHNERVLCITLDSRPQLPCALVRRPLPHASSGSPLLLAQPAPLTPPAYFT